MFQAIFAALRLYVLLPLVMVAGVGVAFSGSHATPSLFLNTDQFVLFATDKVTLDAEVQVSSGDLGSNSELILDKNVLVSGDLFADKLTLGASSTVNGNVAYNKLKKANTAMVLGVSSTTLRLPIATLGSAPEFSTARDNVNPINSRMTLPAGTYRDVTLRKNIRMTLSGGVYTFRSLQLEDGAMLLYTASTTVNIQRALKGSKNVSILPLLAQQTGTLTVNYRGFKFSNENNRHDEWDDDRDAHGCFDDDNERNEWSRGKVAQPVVFLEGAFLNFTLNAPSANVLIGKNSTVLGQVLAKKIWVTKGGVLSRKEAFVTKPDQTKIVTEGNTHFFVNEIIVQLVPTASTADANIVARSVGGRVVGVITLLHLYKIEVQTSNSAGLRSLIQQIIDTHNPVVTSVTLNFLMENQ